MDSFGWTKRPLAWDFSCLRELFAGPELFTEMFYQNFGQARTKFCDVAFSRYPLHYVNRCISCDEGVQKTSHMSHITFMQ